MRAYNKNKMPFNDNFSAQNERQIKTKIKYDDGF